MTRTFPVLAVVVSLASFARAADSGVKMSAGKFQLIVVPLHGLGNKDGKGSGVRVLAYDVPDDPRGQWTTHSIDDTMHMTHNLEVTSMGDHDAILIAGLEGVKVRIP